MVEPLVIEIDAPNVGLNIIDIPALFGYTLLVHRGARFLTSTEVRTLPTGGFELKIVGDVFVLGEVFTVIPIPNIIAPSISIPSYAVNQYPHRMVITKVAATTQDGSGNWVTTDGPTEEKYCRAEPSSGNSFFTSADGKQLIYSFTVYMPLPAPDLKPGHVVSLYDQENNLLGVGEIKRFSKGQLNARAWL